MARPRRSERDLLQLQREWDERLKQKGFVDIEDRETGFLKNWTGSSPLPSENPPPPKWGRLQQKSSAKSKRDTASYYRLAGSFLHEHPFKNAEDRRVWELHADGLSNRKLAKKLKMPLIRVRRILARHKKIMLGPVQLATTS